MILAFHSIFTTYGTWLPNEPRGSWSTFVASWELDRFGKATTVRTTRSLANQPYDRNTKIQMQRVLKHPPVRLTGDQALTAATAFAQTPYTLHALAIRPIMFTWSPAIHDETYGARSGRSNRKRHEPCENAAGTRLVRRGRITDGMST